MGLFRQSRKKDALANVGPGSLVRAVDWVTVLSSILGLVLIPILVLVLRAVRKAGTNEEKLDNLIDSKDETHRLIMDMIKNLDRRIRWIEEQRFGRQR